jgi:hypothetical protein
MSKHEMLRQEIIKKKARIGHSKQEHGKGITVIIFLSKYRYSVIMEVMSIIADLLSMKGA